MRTSTHRHLRFTPADMTAVPRAPDFARRNVGRKEWAKFVTLSLVRAGFKMDQPIFKSGGVPGYDFILSQRLEV